MSVSAPKSSLTLVTPPSGEYRASPRVTLFGSPIPTNQTTKVLGVTIDRGMTFRHHVAEVNAKGRSRLNVVRVPPPPSATPRSSRRPFTSSLSDRCLNTPARPGPPTSHGPRPFPHPRDLPAAHPELGPFGSRLDAFAPLQHHTSTLCPMSSRLGSTMTCGDCSFSVPPRQKNTPATTSTTQSRPGEVCAEHPCSPFRHPSLLLLPTGPKMPGFTSTVFSSTWTRLPVTPYWGPHLLPLTLWKPHFAGLIASTSLVWDVDTTPLSWPMRPDFALTLTLLPDGARALRSLILTPSRSARPSLGPGGRTASHLLGISGNPLHPRSVSWEKSESSNPHVSGEPSPGRRVTPPLQEEGEGLYNHNNASWS